MRKPKKSSSKMLPSLGSELRHIWANNNNNLFESFMPCMLLSELIPHFLEVSDLWILIWSCSVDSKKHSPSSRINFFLNLVRTNLFSLHKFPNTLFTTWLGNYLENVDKTFENCNIECWLMSRKLQLKIQLILRERHINNWLQSN